ncbi:PadR family transcriptional regulator [Noviherbaspirillum denitrificans]|uniref:PadR family transcriptional regulator n=1 Tax=Noviherbaspirillum denitrificans TaxID=1968433 RepID=A0A254TC41_9BURK|nr:PadR family transcriptional regulator [Noviherbaspirillum denitrificans]OWW20200.1 PadR family transcriptional regulator [Noviherbaspirillum denitrificans]
MSLPHALLTALIEHPGSGLELARRFDHSIGYFWHATHQQIYRELGRLEEAGWVESLPAESARGGKKIYQVLPAGRKELKRWTAESQDPRPLRDELMLRLRAEAIVGPTAVKDDIMRRLAMHQERLATYRKIEQRDFSGKSPSREQQVQHLVLKAGIMHEELWIEWSQNALNVLAQTDSKP